MRNLVGFRFPHLATPSELEQIANLVLKANAESRDALQRFLNMTMMERNYLVACRLISPQFSWQENGHPLFLDHKRTLALMVNEEDHIRMQAVVGGWAINEARILAEKRVEALQPNLKFAQSDKFGYLATSPLNSGQGRRLSAMVHLIGLAHTRKLPQILRALTAQGLNARGLFGEGSRAIGAFVQVSATSGSLSQFTGACEYLIAKEMSARESCNASEISHQFSQACQFASGHRALSLADALRVLSWARFATAAKLPGAFSHLREADMILTRLELTEGESKSDAENRTNFIRKSLRL